VGFASSPFISTRQGVGLMCDSDSCRSPVSMQADYSSRAKTSLSLRQRPKPRAGQRREATLHRTWRNKAGWTCAMCKENETEDDPVTATWRHVNFVARPNRGRVLVCEDVE